MIFHYLIDDASVDPVQKFFKVILLFVQQLEAAHNDNTKCLVQHKKKQLQMVQLASKLHYKQDREKRKILKSVRLPTNGQNINTSLANKSPHYKDNHISVRQCKRYLKSLKLSSLSTADRSYKEQDAIHGAVPKKEISGSDNLFRRFHDEQQKEGTN